jgi:spermidine synthase
VIEVMAPVIDWHRRGLVPLGSQLTSDPRCNLVCADFFDLASSAHSGFDGSDKSCLVHAILVDIDHSPDHWLNPGNAAFYSPQGLRKLADKLHPGGVFGLWSNDLPEPGFMGLLDSAFESAQSHIISFPNPYLGGESSNTVYLARKGVEQVRSKLARFKV